MAFQKKLRENQSLVVQILGAGPGALLVLGMVEKDGPKSEWIALKASWVKDDFPNFPCVSHLIPSFSTESIKCSFLVVEGPGEQGDTPPPAVSFPTYGQVSHAWRRIRPRKFTSVSLCCRYVIEMLEGSHAKVAESLYKMPCALECCFIVELRRWIGRLKKRKCEFS